jgi:hypothetical protein
MRVSAVEGTNVQIILKKSQVTLDSVVGVEYNMFRIVNEVFKPLGSLASSPSVCSGAYFLRSFCSLDGVL